MNQIYSSPVEPRRLTIIRHIFIFLIATGLLVYFGVQLDRYINSPRPRQTIDKQSSVAVPGVLFVTDFAVVVTNITMQGKNDDAVLNGTPRIQDLTGHLKNLTWGLDIIQGGPADLEKSTRALNYLTEAWVLVPGNNWRLTPKGKQDGEVIDTNNRNFSSILCTFSKKPLPPSSMRDNSGISTYILNQEEMDALLNARKRKNPLPVSSLNWAKVVRTQWGIQKNIRLEQRNFKKDEHTTIDYQITYDSHNINEFHLGMHISPNNKQDMVHDLYLIPEQEDIKLYRWYDVVSPVGGALTVALYMFTFLFGQKRLKPWGIMQQLFLRKRILSKVPRSVAVIGSAWGTPKYNPPGHDSALEHQIEEAVHESARPPAIPPTYSEAIQTNRSHTTIQFADDPHPRQRQVPGMPNSLLEAFQQLREEVDEMKTRLASINLHAQPTSTARYLTPSAINNGNQTDVDISVNSSRASNYNMFTNARLAELEAFRQRIELFYLASDLFEVQGGPDANKRSTLQIISNLNL